MVPPFSQAEVPSSRSSRPTSPSPNPSSPLGGASPCTPRLAVPSFTSRDGTSLPVVLPPYPRSLLLPNRVAPPLFLSPLPHSLSLSSGRSQQSRLPFCFFHCPRNAPPLLLSGPPPLLSSTFSRSPRVLRPSPASYRVVNYTNVISY